MNATFRHNKHGKNSHPYKYACPSHTFDDRFQRRFKIRRTYGAQKSCAHRQRVDNTDCGIDGDNLSELCKGLDGSLGQRDSGYDCSDGRAKYRHAYMTEGSRGSPLSGLGWILKGMKNYFMKHMHMSVGC